jgi:hypothetical protein
VLALLFAQILVLLAKNRRFIWMRSEGALQVSGHYLDPDIGASVDAV